MDTEQLLLYIRGINVANEFQVTTLDNITDSKLMKSKYELLHSELSEGTEELRGEDHEEFITELADVNIRILDQVGYSQHNALLIDDAKPILFDNVTFDDPMGLSNILGELRVLVEDSRKYWLLDNQVLAVYILGILYQSLILIADDLGYDLREVIEKKLEKNKGRGKRHGGKAF